MRPTASRAVFAAALLCLPACVQTFYYHGAARRRHVSKYQQSRIMRPTFASHRVCLSAVRGALPSLLQCQLTNSIYQLHGVMVPAALSPAFDCRPVTHRSVVSLCWQRSKPRMRSTASGLVLSWRHRRQACLSSLLQRSCNWSPASGSNGR